MERFKIILMCHDCQVGYEDPTNRGMKNEGGELICV